MTGRRTLAWLAALAFVACGGSVASVHPSPNGDADASTTPVGPFDATTGDDGSSPSNDGGDAGDASISPPPHGDSGPDADTCGVCPGTCFGARCMVVLASGQISPGPIAVTSHGVVWVNGGQPDTQYAESAVMTVGLDGGTTTRIASTPGSDDVMDLVADESSIVWTYLDDIVAVPTTLSGPPSTLASNVGPAFLAMDDAGIYWTSETTPYVTSVAWRMDRDGGSPTMLMQGAGAPEEILAYAGVVYWQSYDSAGSYETSIYAVGTDGSDPTTLASDLGSGRYPWAVDALGLYWGTDYDPIQILQLGFDGGAPVVVATEFTPAAMTADSTTVYFTNDNSVYEMPTDGGAPVAVAWRLPSPSQIAVDDQSIYWSDMGTCDAGVCTGEVLKLTPK